MVYLDYSATTPVNPEVLKTFDKVSLEYPGNANSLHELGRKSADLMNASVKQIADILKVNSDEIILTSGASEANNLAILGTILKYRNRGKHILTTKLEHSSVSETVKFLESFGYTIEYLNLLPLNLSLLFPLLYGFMTGIGFSHRIFSIMSILD